jgi:hypothetical protein
MTEAERQLLLELANTIADELDDNGMAVTADVIRRLVQQVEDDAAAGDGK